MNNYSFTYLIGEEVDQSIIENNLDEIASAAIKIINTENEASNSFSFMNLEITIVKVAECPELSDIEDDYCLMVTSNE